MELRRESRAWDGVTHRSMVLCDASEEDQLGHKQTEDEVLVYRVAVTLQVSADTETHSRIHCGHVRLKNMCIYSHL